jgi:hypothetical protein
MQQYVKNVSKNQGLDIATKLQKMIDSKLISEEELIAIQLEYEDEHLEDWKIHLNQANTNQIMH